jgi:hypothetical protein
MSATIYARVGRKFETRLTDIGTEELAEFKNGVQRKLHAVAPATLGGSCSMALTRFEFLTVWAGFLSADLCCGC